MRNLVIAPLLFVLFGLAVPAQAWTITAQALDGNGSISPSGTKTAVGCPAYTITPKPGYVVADVKVNLTYDYENHGDVRFSTTDGNVVTAVFDGPITENLVIRVTFRKAVVISSATPGNPVPVAIGSTTNFMVDAWEPAGASMEYRWYVDGTRILPGPNQDPFPYTAPMTPGTHEVKVCVGAFDVMNFASFRGHVRYLWTVQVYDPANSRIINASAGTGGSVSPAGATTVIPNSNATYTIAPSEGYVIGDVSVDGASVGPVSTYTFSNVTDNHTISAAFTALPAYTIKATVKKGGGAIRTNLVTWIYATGGTMTVKAWQGDDRVFEIVPDPGYKISKVVVDGVTVGQPTTYPFNYVNANHTISAVFTRL